VAPVSGVEPVIRAVQRTLDVALGSPYSHLTSLDFSNAFNTVDRRDIAKGLHQFAPALYQAGKWAYGSPTDLVMAADPSSPLNTPPTILSAQGVRLDNPLRPLYLHLSVR